MLVATVLTRQGYFSTTTDAAYVGKQSKAQISKHTTKVLYPKYCSKDIMTILFSKPNLFLILPIVAFRSGNLSFKKQYKTIWYYNEIYWVSPLSFCIVYNCWARAHGWWHDSGLLIFTAPQIVFFCLFSKKKGQIYTKCNIFSLKTIYWIHYVHRLSRRIEFSANNKTVANIYFFVRRMFQHFWTVFFMNVHS